MIFDQYSRYQACSDLLRQTGIKTGSTILDVGSGPECLFKQFVPDMTVSFVDPLIPSSSGERKIRGTVFTEELNGLTFDCLTAVDVFEHIPLNKRSAFLDRISSLSEQILVLGFPTSDTTVAYETDRAIDKQYVNITGVKYLWLKEHYEYGLPSLSNTIDHLQDLGWYCQTLGHGHAPWLREFLTFVICALDIPELEDLVLTSSKRFNNEFYSYDFRPPFYRQFVIASRTPLPIITPPTPGDATIAEIQFSTLMNEVREKYFVTSLRLISDLIKQLNSATTQWETAVAEIRLARNEREKMITERNEAVVERDRVASELNMAITERDAAMTKRNAAVAEWDVAVAQRDAAVAERHAAVTERNAARAQRDAAVTERNAARVQRDAAVAERNAVVTEWNAARVQRDVAVTERNAARVQRDAAVTERNAAKTQRDAAMTERNAARAQRNAAVTERNAARAQRDAAVTERNAAKAQRDAAVTERNAAKAQRDAAVTEQNAAKAQRDAAVTERNTARAQRDAAVAQRNTMITERDTATTEQYAVEALVDQIRNSRSWRITQPIRFAARLTRYGLIASDRDKIVKVLRYCYQKLPFPKPLKRVTGLTYHRIHTRSAQIVKASAIDETNDPCLSFKIIAQQKGLPDYIVWGVIDWHFRYQRPQHLASQIAASNRRVFYVSEQLLDRSIPGFDVEALDISGRLFQVKLYVKGSPTIYNTAPSPDLLKQMMAGVGELMQWANVRDTVSFVQHAFWYGVASCLPNSRMVYDCMDHHEGFGNTATEILALERALITQADLTVTTSGYLDHVVSQHTDRRVLIRNAGEYDHFAPLPKIVYRDRFGRRIIGYYGAIAEWFDQDLVEAIARNFRDCLILLVGADSVNAEKRLGQIRNIKFIGEVPYAELPYYLHSFDVCILPFQIVPLTLATNPVKIYEYLSAGKTVVAVDLPELKQFGELVRIAADTAGFIDTIARSLDTPAAESEIKRRQGFAQQQTWGHRAKALIDSVEMQVSEPQVSVIVVTYNNLDLTKACLNSIDRYSNYKALELIVVDNASTDGTREFLTQWATAAPSRKLILNDGNRGFAAGNNQGLEIASGEFLVLLNNDTYVTPGWVRTLRRHLQRDSSIGLIGPVTNNIGNEAQIDIAYTDMDEMLSASALYTRNHIGQLLQIRTAAFFCVMIPRTTYQKVGPLDEAFGRGFFEDDDYCRRIESTGLRIVCTEDVFIHHHLSASFSKLKHHKRQQLFDENKTRYEAKWGKWIPHQYR